MNNEQYLNNLRHSAAHLLAAAVLKLWPGTQNAIGPAIENGFYQDFDFGDKKISEDDFPAIEKEMASIVKSWSAFEVQEVSAEEAKKHFVHNPYKVELIEEFSEGGKTITENNPGGFLDLCKGGHLERPAEELKFFKLLKIAGAYWRGDEKNKMLTRIYGTAFPTQAKLDAYLEQLEEAKKRDHKKLGKDLDLFVFSETVGKGLPLYTPKGATIRRELERFIVDEELRRGYLHVYTPDIANLDLYKKSGHYPYYKDTMYAPIQIDDEEYMLRPMTCPHHFELFLTKPHSYKELPMRIAELAKLYRYEQSGELMGLLRVRSFCLADAHIVARKEQAEVELNGVLDLIEYIASIFGIKQTEHYRFRLSLGDRQDETKYYKDDASWDYAEDVLRKVLQKRGSDFYEAPQEAAFYGPKIDIQMKNVNGKEDTAFTVQYDFVMPKRFNLSFTNESGQEEQPIVIHRSSIGAIERVMAFLIEHFAGAFPTWLSPLQAVVIPISQEVNDYAVSVTETLVKAGIRAENWNEAESMQNKIRKAEGEKIPYMLVVGRREEQGGQVAVRARGNKNRGVQTVEVFTKYLQENIATKSLTV